MIFPADKIAELRRLPADRAKEFFLEALDEIERLQADLAHAVGCSGGTLHSTGTRREGWLDIPTSTWTPCLTCQRIRAELDKQKPAKEVR